jgi:Ca-activated chloride channel family protein
MFCFKDPIWLVGLVIIPFIIWWMRRTKRATMRFSSIEALKKISPPPSLKWLKIVSYLNIAAILFFIIAIARPRSGKTYEEVITKGIDIVLALDISSSMRALDFKPYDRIYVARETASDFIKGRKNDRIGLVIFARNAFTQCPLTLDYDILLELLKEVKVGMIKDGTAIGMGLATAINRLKNSKAKGKVIILLTDGRNNAGEIDPETATELAKSLGIKIYTIGVGKPGPTLYPVNTALGVRYVQVQGQELDEDMLQRIANSTGGLYFRAETEQSLHRIFKTIDKMEKVKFKTRKFTRYRELFVYFVSIGFCLVLFAVFLSDTRFRKIP